jgi:hypothetical protein
MKKDTPCKNCGKLVNHISKYCLDHRRAWRDGYKMGVALRETVTDQNPNQVVKDLEEYATYPVIQANGFSPLLLRAANTIKKLREKNEI